MTCLGKCDDNNKPHTTEECHVPGPCSQEWLTGRWTVCSHSCGHGVQSRTVECVITGHSGLKNIAPDHHCTDKKKPKTHRRCHIQRCQAEWFTTEWSQCSQQCGVLGVRSREVVCLDNNTVSDQCNTPPDTSEECSVNTCNSEQTEYQDNEQDDEEDDYNEIEDIELDSTTKATPLLRSRLRDEETFISNEIVPEKYLMSEEGCKDKFKNCNVVVQSRLCRYSFYQSNCCRSCARIRKPRS